MNSHKNRAAIHHSTTVVSHLIYSCHDGAGRETDMFVIGHLVSAGLSYWGDNQCPDSAVRTG